MAGPRVQLAFTTGERVLKANPSVQKRPDPGGWISLGWQIGCPKDTGEIGGVGADALTGR